MPCTHLTLLAKVTIVIVDVTVVFASVVELLPFSACDLQQSKAFTPRADA